MRRVLLALLLTGAAIPAPAQQPAPSALSPALTLRGVVVDAGSGGALPRARVTVISGSASVAAALTDADGRFSVAVPAGAARSIRIVKAGYASISVRVSPSQISGADPLRIDVPRGAVIAGRAVDAAGEPAARVAIRRLASPEGAAWSAVGFDGVLSADNVFTLFTDERGEYRVGGLPAGRYLVEAYPAGTRMTISPSGLNVQAIDSPFQAGSVTVDLQAGAQAGVDLVLERRPSGSSPIAPEPDASGGTIRGTVISTAGLPVSGATVSAQAAANANYPGRELRTTRTDAFGRFTLRGISAGSITVRADKRGYVQSQNGQRGRALPGLPVTVEAGKDLDDISIVLPRAGVISGIVLDEYGEPLQEVGVQLVRVRRDPAGALAGVREQGGLVQRTDDRGQFRLSAVPPGDYAVMALLPAEIVDPAAVRTVYTPAYYPDTADFASAAPIRIADGEDIPGVILTMRRVPVARVSGVAHDSRGLPVAGTVRLTSRHAVTIGIGPIVARPGPDGEFVFPDVTPGDYLLQTRVESGPAASEFATSRVTVVDRDPAPVLIRTSPGSRLSGRIVLEDDAGRILWGYSATSVAVDSPSSPGSMSNLGSPISTGQPFTLNALAGPTRLLLSTNDENWYLKSVLINGVDVADTPFDFGFDGRDYSDVEVVFSRRGASITGRVTDERAAPVGDYAVVVFSSDPGKWVVGSRWIRLARSSADGGFTVSALPPGDYWVAAIDRVDAPPVAPDWVDVELLTALAPRSTRVTLGEGQSHATSLRVITR